MLEQKNFNILKEISKILNDKPKEYENNKSKRTKDFDNSNNQVKKLLSTKTFHNFYENYDKKIDLLFKNNLKENSNKIGENSKLIIENLKNIQNLLLSINYEIN
jgi:hypothetical protein